MPVLARATLTRYVKPSYRCDFGWPISSRISYALWRKSYTGGPVARARSFWHHVICKHSSEVCGECGRPVEQAWLADNETWQNVMGDEGGLLCISCFDAMLEGHGHFVRWVPEVRDGAAR